MLFNLKNIELETPDSPEIERYKIAIYIDQKKLEHYDSLSQSYIDVGKFSVAELLVNDLKWNAFEKFSCFDETLLKGLKENPFDWDTPLASRMTFNTKIEKLENFYETFRSLSVKKASKLFFEVNKLFNKPYLHRLLEILFKNSNWADVNDKTEVLSVADHYISKIWYFAKNKEAFVKNSDIYFKVVKLLIPALESETPDFIRKRTI